MKEARGLINFLGPEQPDRLFVDGLKVNNEMWSAYGDGVVLLHVLIAGLATDEPRFDPMDFSTGSTYKLSTDALGGKATFECVDIYDFPLWVNGMPHRCVTFKKDA